MANAKRNRAAKSLASGQKAAYKQAKKVNRKDSAKGTWHPPANPGSD